MTHSKHGANIALYNFKILDLYSPGKNIAPIRMAGVEKTKRTGNKIIKNNIPRIIRNTNPKMPLITFWLLFIYCFRLFNTFHISSIMCAVQFP